MNVKLMDVTLRESIYVKTPLALEHAKQMVEGLSSSNVDYIEIGYVSPHSKGGYLPSHSPLEYINAIAESIAPGSQTKFVLMLHPHHYDSGLLDRITHPKVGLVRLCIPLDKADFSLPIIKELKQTGVRVSANLIRISHATADDILHFTNKVEGAGADFLYLADSNGAMLPKQVSSLYKMLIKNSDLELGFHPHNNMHLASANALEAIYAGATVIDGSLYGFGKGVANLCIESFVAILNRSGLFEKRNLGRLIETAKQAYGNFIYAATDQLFVIAEKGILAGYHNINLDILDSLEQKAKEKEITSLDLLLDIENQVSYQPMTSLLKEIV